MLSVAGARPSYPSAWLLPGRARFRFTWRGHFTFTAKTCKQRWRCLLPAKLPLPASLFQLAIAGSMDLSLTSGEHILRGHVTDRAMQAHGVVVIHVALNQAPGILQGQRCQWPDTLAFKRLVPAFELAIRLWVKRRGPYVSHTGDPNARGNDCIHPARCTSSRMCRTR